jgi:hypothetical protein
MEGKGFCMIVKPETYDYVSRAFGRGKGVELALSPEEILANQQASADMEGKGIFGKKFDRFLERKGIKKAVYKFGDVFKEGLKKGIDYVRGQAPDVGGKAFRGIAESLGRPELGTLAESVGRFGADYVAGKTAGRAKGYLDNPEGRGFVSNIGGTNGSVVHRSRTLADEVEQQRALDALNMATGMNTGYSGRANLAVAKSMADRAKFIKSGVREATTGRGMGGYGMESARGRLASDIASMGRFSKSGGQIGAMGQAVLPPALRSQPYSENFQFQFTLPPAFQRIR